MLFIRRKKNLKIKQSKKIFIQVKFCDFEIFFSSLKNVKIIQKFKAWTFERKLKKKIVARSLKKKIGLDLSLILIIIKQFKNLNIQTREHLIICDL
ncbi:hypothetical protein BpHYR1_021662 [Brachionus plicatilis]|uniref:Uncharacterized protein n=1 Tax=Brachionus plicatilis TaxID=10195 RepID=A0A3M7RUH4_BRAPC|nr:hypothetical protein BpHYR1_021662 [Brachionus plicatilis]